MLFSRKSFVLIISYNFWVSCKCLIQGTSPQEIIITHLYHCCYHNETLVWNTCYEDFRYKKSSNIWLFTHFVFIPYSQHFVGLLQGYMTNRFNTNKPLILYTKDYEITFNPKPWDNKFIGLGLFFYYYLMLILPICTQCKTKLILNIKNDKNM